MKTIIYSIIFLFTVLGLHAQDGHQLWLRNKKALPVTVVSAKNSATLTIAKEELQQGWQGKAGATVALIIKKDKALKGDGFRLTSAGIEANTDLGLLYGAYELLRHQQTGQAVRDEVFNPSYEIRTLNHWDNLP